MLRHLALLCFAFEKSQIWIRIWEYEYENTNPSNYVLSLKSLKFLCVITIIVACKPMLCRSSQCYHCLLFSCRVFHCKIDQKHDGRVSTLGNFASTTILIKWHIEGAVWYNSSMVSSKPLLPSINPTFPQYSLRKSLQSPAKLTIS